MDDLYINHEVPTLSLYVLRIKVNLEVSGLFFKLKATDGEMEMLLAAEPRDKCLLI